VRYSAALIVAARKRKQFRRQEELGTEIGVNKETINRIENGANVEVDTLLKVCDALDLPITEVFIARDLARHGPSVQRQAPPQEGAADDSAPARVLKNQRQRIRQIAAELLELAHDDNRAEDRARTKESAKTRRGHRAARG